MRAASARRRPGAPPRRGARLGAAIAAAGIASCLVTPTAAHADEPYRISFDGESSVLVASADNLFAHFGSIVPGETRTGSVMLENESGAPCAFFLRAEEEARAERDDAADAPSRMRLTIESNGATVYEGDLAAARLLETVPLGSVEAGGELEIAFAVSAPTDLGNEYALASVEAPWTFVAQQNAAAGKGSPLPATGDSGNALAAAALAGAGAAAVLIARMARTRLRAERDIGKGGSDAIDQT